MKILDESEAWSRSYELLSHEELAGDFRLLSNAVFSSIAWLDHLQERPLKRGELAKTIADDVESAIRVVMNPKTPIYSTVDKSMPRIKKQIVCYVMDRLRRKALIGQQYYVRTFIAANALDVVGREMRI